MDWFLLFGLIGFGLLIVGWLGYSAYTNSIIRGQEKEIERLTSQNHRLNAEIYWLEKEARQNR